MAKDAVVLHHVLFKSFMTCIHLFNDTQVLANDTDFALAAVKANSLHSGSKNNDSEEMVESS